MGFIMKILLLLLCILCACGTSKHSTDIEKNDLIKLNLSDSIFRQDSSITIEHILSNKNLQTHIIVTEFSRPDSSGKQYPVKTTEINLNKQESDQSNKQVVSGSQTTEINQTNLYKKADEKIKEDASKDSRPIQSWIWWLLVVCVVGLFLLRARK